MLIVTVAVVVVVAVLVAGMQVALLRYHYAFEVGEDDKRHALLVLDVLVLHLFLRLWHLVDRLTSLDASTPSLVCVVSTLVLKVAQAPLTPAQVTLMFRHVAHKATKVFNPGELCVPVEKIDRIVGVQATEVKRLAPLPLIVE
jgi:uncharacterized membrane-anchored protein